MFVSVIVPTFNRGDLIRDTIRTIVNQSVAPAEVYILDDGSTDNTAAACASFAKEKLSSRTKVVYLHQENAGKSVALNKGLALASGELIAFDDSDDLWHPRKLELQLDALKRFPTAKACFTDARFVNNPALRQTAFERAGFQPADRVGLIEDAVPVVLNRYAAIFMQSILLGREVMNRVGPFDPALRVGQDTDFIFRLALEGPLCYVNEPLVEIDRTEVRAQGLTTHSGQKSLVRLKARETMYQKWRTLPAVQERYQRTVARAASGNYVALSDWQIENGSLDEARRALRRALRVRPSFRLFLRLALLTVAPGFLKKRLNFESGQPTCRPAA
jgi:glycosyltransferase involved in cell wall biosynthesis